jgi:hypothetical protein
MATEIARHVISHIFSIAIAGQSQRNGLLPSVIISVSQGNGTGCRNSRLGPEIP